MSHKPNYDHSPTASISDIRCMACLVTLIMIVSGISLALLLTY